MMMSRRRSIAAPVTGDPWDGILATRPVIMVSGDEDEMEGLIERDDNLGVKVTTSEEIIVLFSNLILMIPPFPP